MTADFESSIVSQINDLVILGCASIILGYFQIAFWSMAAERQTRAIREKLFRSILRKDIVYFDTHKTGELNTRLTDDIDKIHDGIGDKLGPASQFLTACVTGLILGKFKYIYLYRNRKMFFLLYRFC
jgi:ABC-type multidrug transport system fused ATPase/permease subunit